MFHHVSYVQHIVTVFMYVVCLIYCSFPVTIPIVIEFFIPSNETAEKVYLFDAEYGVNSDDYYVLIFIHMSVLTYVTCIVMISNDSMYFVYVEHACALFEIVRFVNNCLLFFFLSSLITKIIMTVMKYCMYCKFPKTGALQGKKCFLNNVNKQ